MSVDSVLIAAQAPLAMSTISGSDDGSISAYSRRMAFPKSHVRINVDNHFNSKVYTSGSSISGTVSITTQRDVRFDSIQVLLMGATRTRVDGVGSQSESTHVFLKMDMPIPESLYPVPRILESGRTITVPFNFIIPRQLTIGACNHHMISDLVRDHHVRLPPSLGSWEKDDLAPEMAKIEYSIRARVFREPELGGRMVKVIEASQLLRVLPASPEDPPLSITKHDRPYKMAKTKTLRKNLLSSKLGKLTATATQPGAVRLQPDGLGISSTDVRLHLHFEPSSPGLGPPKVTSVSAKVSAHTHFASGPISTFPNLGDWQRSISAEKRGSYSTSVSLFSQAIDMFKWSEHANLARRDSGYSSDGGPGYETDRTELASDQRRSRHVGKKPRRSTPDVFHSAILQVPIKLPLDRKIFVPTFHSCIASRVYILQLTVMLSAGPISSTVNLSVPLQISVEGDMQDNAGLPSFEMALEEAEVDALLRPRLLAVPEDQFRETSVLPGYGAWDGRQQSRRPVMI